MRTFLAEIALIMFVIGVGASGCYMVCDVANIPLTWGQAISGMAVLHICAGTLKMVNAIQDYED